MKLDLKNKFVVGYDTLADGHQCWMQGEEGEDNYQPLLFDTEDEAIAELFDSNLSMLQSHLDSGMLEDYNEGVTTELIDVMSLINDSGDVVVMREFMKQNPQCNDIEAFVQAADEFIMNRKAVFGPDGMTIMGTKLFNL